MTDAFFDTECYPNYWLLKFRPVGKPVITANLREGQVFSPSQISAIAKLFRDYTVISFNGIRYDVPMITAALMGFTPERLKVINDRIITDKIPAWKLGLVDWKPEDHIDVMGVIPGHGGMKYKSAIIHAKTIRELPYPIDAILTEDQIPHVDSYCENDLDLLEALYNYVKPQIEQRESLGRRYGVDLRSHSDAQIAETVLRLRCEKSSGKRAFKPNVDYNMAFRYKTPPFIEYSSSELMRVLELVRGSVFRLNHLGVVDMPPELKGLEIKIGSMSYKMGIGGLHSQEKSRSIYSNDTHVLRDIDVASYYPNLMVNAGSYPPALGSHFINEFNNIKIERLAAKRLQSQLKKAGDVESEQYIEAKTINEGSKIQINGTFGKTGSQYSILFAPEMLIQTTLTGQLLLLMLIEWHESYGIPVVSANTDGIVIYCHREKLYISEALIAEWENRTGLEMETVEYSSLHSKDVNNYIAIG